MFDSFFADVEVNDNSKSDTETNDDGRTSHDSLQTGILHLLSFCCRGCEHSAVTAGCLSTSEEDIGLLMKQ